MSDLTLGQTVRHTDPVDGRTSAGVYLGETDDGYARIAFYTGNVPVTEIEPVEPEPAA